MNPGSPVLYLLNAATGYYPDLIEFSPQIYSFSWHLCQGLTSDHFFRFSD